MQPLRGFRVVDLSQVLMFERNARRVRWFRVQHRVTLIAGFLHGSSQASGQTGSRLELRCVGQHVHFHALAVIGTDADPLAFEQRGELARHGQSGLLELVVIERISDQADQLALRSG